MTNASECVINEIIFENSNPYVKRDFYNFGEKKFFFSWEFDEKANIRLRNDDETFKKLAKDTLLVIYPKSLENKMSPRMEDYRAYDVHPIKIGLSRKGYQFKADYGPNALESEVLVYHLVLPDQCYFKKGSIQNDNNTGYYIVTREKHQSITWVRGPGNPPQTFKATFVCEGEDKFNKQRQKLQRIFEVSPKIKQIGVEAKNIGTQVAAEALKKMIVQS